jgi:hypothetical protein
MAVPELGYVPGLTFSGKNLCGGSDNLGWVRAYQQICSFRNGNRALGVFAQRQAGHIQGSRFFLDGAGVRQDQSGFTEEAEKIEIADRSNNTNVCLLCNSCLCESLPGARMNGENDWYLFGNRIDGSEKMGELFAGNRRLKDDAE